MWCPPTLIWSMDGSRRAKWWWWGSQSLPEDVTSCMIQKYQDHTGQHSSTFPPNSVISTKAQCWLLWIMMTGVIALCGQHLYCLCYKYAPCLVECKASLNNFLLHHLSHMESFLTSSRRAFHKIQGATEMKPPINQWMIGRNSQAMLVRALDLPCKLILWKILLAFNRVVSSGLGNLGIRLGNTWSFGGMEPKEGRDFNAIESIFQSRGRLSTSLHGFIAGVMKDPEVWSDLLFLAISDAIYRTLTFDVSLWPIPFETAIVASHRQLKCL